jgi:2-C-methyl-D-erythritol 4-phosphate cytidylyltransferase
MVFPVGYSTTTLLLLVLVLLQQRQHHIVVVSFTINPLSSSSSLLALSSPRCNVPSVVSVGSNRNVIWNMAVTSDSTSATLDTTTATTTAATAHSNYNENDDDTMISDVGIIILAGGTGSRMKASLPKQFLLLNNKPILHHSIELFLQQPFLPTSSKSSYFHHVVLVLDPMYQAEYQYMIDKYRGRLSFANPGKERQGSVENGLNQLIRVSNSGATTTAHNIPNCTYVAIHDSARPLVTIMEIINVIRDAKRSGTAAVLSVPCKATIKESSDQGISVLRTIPRERLYEVHTPQVIRIDLLREGFEQVRQNAWSVTDDVSIIEQLNETVLLTRGEYTNIKITTPEDMEVAEAILRDRKQQSKKQNNARRRRIIGSIVAISNSFWDKVSFWKRKEIDFQI